MPPGAALKKQNNKNKTNKQKTFYFIPSAKFLWPSKVTYSQVSGIRAWRSLRGHYSIRPPHKVIELEWGLNERIHVKCEV